MYVLLAFNYSAAFIGDFNGKVWPEKRPDGQAFQAWKLFLHSEYQEPVHVGKNRQYITVNRSIPVASPDGQNDNNRRIMRVKETVPLATYSDKEYDISVRAAFDPYMKTWFVADRDSAD